MPRAKIEVADVFRKFKSPFIDQHGSVLNGEQWKAFNAIINCRTSAMGGFLYRCSDRAGCGFEQPQYRSCLNRHCPRCQGSARARWLSARMEEVLPVAYFHVVFTLPSEFRPLALHNKKRLYGLLFKTAAETMVKIGKDPKHLGARMGMVGVLHTWGQKLDHHPHVHFMVPGGGLAEDNSRWIDTPEGYLLPVKVLSPVFRGKFMQAVQRLYRDGTLSLTGSLKHLKEPKAFQRLLNKAVKKPWVVYAKRPFSGPSVMLKYIARYTHRVALTAYRLLELDDTGVLLSYKDYRSPEKLKQLRLAGPELIRRVLMHVVPRGFQRIRYYGFMAARQRKASLALCRRLLADRILQVEEEVPSSDGLPKEFTLEKQGDGVEAFNLNGDAPKCPKCNIGHLLIGRELAPIRPWKLKIGQKAETAISPTHSGPSPPI